jgi:hypothetical protein
VNRDGHIGATDATLVLQYDAGIIHVLASGRRPAPL